MKLHEGKGLSAVDMLSAVMSLNHTHVLKINGILTSTPSVG